MTNGLANYRQACELLNKAAEAGNTYAQALLGQIFAGGLGVAQNYKAAAMWFQKAAVKDNPSEVRLQQATAKETQALQNALAMSEDEIQVGKATNIKLNGLEFAQIAIDGLTPAEIELLTKRVNNQLKTFESRCFEPNGLGGIDTVRLTLLTALHFAAEQYKLEQIACLATK